MHFQQTESAGPGPAEGPLQGPEKPIQHFVQQSSSLPFGQSVALADIAGPTYLTTQTLIQQVAYTLSDRLWTYSPETFDLDVAVKAWHKEGMTNAHGYTTSVEAMQIRSGAASVALGYVFSQDFDLKKRYIPQTILASSSSLQYLRTALDQLTLLYSVASPFVAHIAAVDYSGGPTPGLVTDYVSALTLAGELGLGVVSSFSTHESQHISLLATLLATVIPTIHLYDGVSTGRETTRVIDVLDQKGLSKTYHAIQHEALASVRKTTDVDTKVDSLLRAFNGELGTDYGLFEYEGHPEPESVLVVFGTVESSLAGQVASLLQKTGAKIGVVKVRVYRPFIEEEFIKAVPKSAKTVGVLGQVHDGLSVSDPAIQSNLYGDVVAAFTFADGWTTLPAVMDVKYPREQVWTPVSIAAAFQLLSSKSVTQPTSVSGEHSNLQIIVSDAVQQYTFWDLDDSASVNASAVLARALASNASTNVTVNTTHDNLLQGGAKRTDIRMAKRTIEAAYSIESADVVFVGDEHFVKQLDVVASLKFGGKIVLYLPGVKDEDIEKKLPAGFRMALSKKAVQLFVLDTQAIEPTANDASTETYLVQLSFLRLAMPTFESQLLQRIASINGNPSIFADLQENIGTALRHIPIPTAWATVDLETEVQSCPHTIGINSFAPVDKFEPEPPSLLKDWQVAAKGLAFKEAFATEASLRPDLSVKAFTVHVKENRRLTPLTYDRNIFHIEFDLGTSGLTYQIGEALGIHAENDEKEVRDFIQFYNLNPEEIAEVPSRDDPSIQVNRTVYQALMQNIDIFGRPPKRFYEALAEFATDVKEKKNLLSLGGLEGINEFKRRAEVDTITFADILLEFASARPAFHDLVRLVDPMKRREYSIASCQKVTPTSVALMIVTVGWVDPKGRDRSGQATRYLNKLRPGMSVTVSVKPSVMKLPANSTDPLIMAGLGTGLAPFRAFVQHRAWEKAQGLEIGPVLLYMGSRHQREEYCYGEEWEAYQDAGVITLLGRAFSRDQPQKIYIQDRMRETMSDIIDAYFAKEGSFYLCGPTWPVPDVQNVLEDAIAQNAKVTGKKAEPRKEIEKLKDAGRYVLEVY